jgi:hypothetical protein
MRRIPWDILLALLIGLGVGLVYSWIISPLRVTDTDPIALRNDFKEKYRSAIAAAYAATGNLTRAQARLALLKDPDPIEALNAQAQRMAANSETFEQADEVAALALALQNGSEDIPTTILPTQAIQEAGVFFTETFPPPPDVPLLLTETPESIETQAVETQPAIVAATPRPTFTALPTLGAPFILTAQDSVCDTNLPDGLLQVIVLNANRRQMAGMKIVITWDGGEEQFFTGLKPELGNGYADYLMTSTITYTVQLAAGSDIATGLIPPTCQTPSGETFFGGMKLTFQQP